MVDTGVSSLKNKPQAGLPESGRYWSKFFEKQTAGGSARRRIAGGDDFKITYTNEVEVIRFTDYYPYGSVMREAGMKYRFGYQGEFAEQDDETGWNAFELRMYDSQIGRWMAPDPYGQYWSPYVGMGNNPESGVDPDGGLFGRWRARRYAERHGGTFSKDKVTGRWWAEGQVSKGIGVWAKDFGHNGFGISANQFEFSMDSNVNAVVNLGLLGYADSGVNGVKLDIASLEMLKWGAASGFNSTTGKKYSSSGIENYIFKDGNIIVKSGMAVETMAGDIKYGNTSIINYNHMTVKNDIRGGVGRPWVEAKYTHSHSGIHEFRFGVQEDFGRSYGPIGGVVSGFVGFTLKYKPN